MTIRQKGYTRWEGTLRERGALWWPITRTGIGLTFKKKFFKFFFAMTLVPALVWLAGIYISERLEDFRFMVRGEGAQFLDVNPAYFKAYFTNDFLLFMLVMILVFCGAGLISDDLRHNALQLYFARPLKKRDYLIGKAGVVLFFLLIVTFVPGIVFILMKLIFSGSMRFLAAYPWLPVSVFAYSSLVTGFFALLTLFLSSVGKNRRYVAVLIFGLYIFSDIFFGIFYGIFRSPAFALVSIKANIQQVGAFLFRQKPPYPVPWIYSLLIILALCVLASVVLKRKVQGVTVIK
ncbi:MAG: ABC transporter permease [Candidatus Aminicenantales bacterium]